VWHQIASRLAGFIGGALIAFLCSVVAFVIAMRLALHAPIADPNMELALHEGAFWSVVGGLLIGFGAAVIEGDLRVRLYYAGLASAVWVTGSGFCFFWLVTAFFLI
jgi:hypothetical protein